MKLTIALAHYIAILIFLQMISTPLYSQTLSDIVDLILQLDLTSDCNQNEQIFAINRRIFGGRVDADIFNSDEDDDSCNLSESDHIDFLIYSFRDNDSLVFYGSGADFQMFIRDSIQPLIGILFPRSLSESLTGKDVAQVRAQESLLTRLTDSPAKKNNISGLVEYERFNIDDFKGKALQSFSRMPFWGLTFSGRYAKIEDDMQSESYNLGIEHSLSRRIGDWSIRKQSHAGFDIFVGGLLSNSSVSRFGTTYLGAGPWITTRRKFMEDKISAAGGLSLQFSTTYIPGFIADEGTKFFIEALNNEGIDLILTSGGILDFPVYGNADLISKLFIVYTRYGNNNQSPASIQTTLLLGVNYLIGGLTPIDFGIKINRGLDWASSESVYFRGNFNF